jgi:hypothetical protein
MTNCSLNDRRCPVCGSINECRIANGCLYKGQCWCESVSIPPVVQRYFAELGLGSACLCRSCLSALAHGAVESNSAEHILTNVRAQVATTNWNQTDDSYVDSSGRTIFTAAFHLKRGNCCGNGCRHCPYGFAERAPSH